MFCLFCDLHFLSQKDGIIVDNTDLGVFAYHERKPPSSHLLYEGKKMYCKGRDIAFTLNNKRPKKLLDSLAEFEETLVENRIVSLEWKSTSAVRAVFDTGLQFYVKVNPQSGDPEEFVQDKFMVGKLSSSYVSDVAIYSHHAIFAYTDNHVMHAFLTKPSLKSSSNKKWSNLDVKLQSVQLAGPAGRRLDKKLSFNTTGDLLLMWWKCGREEVYPWSPHVKAEDRANVHIYSLNGSKFDLVCYFRTKLDPVWIVFSKVNNSTVYTIQQRVSDEGDVTLEWENSEVDCRSLQSNYSLSLALPTHLSALAMSPKEDKLLAACIDGSLLVADTYGNITNRIRTTLIPSLVSWHPDGALILVGNNKGQLQWFDSSLCSVACQLLNHAAESLTLDVGCYFKYQPNLVGLQWNRCITTPIPTDEYHDFLLLHFEKGPLVFLKLFRSHDRRLSTDAVIYQYLSLGAYNNAVSLLYTVDWEVDSELAQSALQSIVNFLMRQPLSPLSESMIEKSLGYFLSPIRPIPESIATEVGEGVHDLARRFFHLLLRYQCVDKAFRLAIDLGKQDLFMDLHYFCKESNNHAMSAAALERADQLLCSSCEGSQSSCDCSESHSSSTSQSISSDAESESTQDLQERIVPPLPIFTSLESSRNKVGYSSILQQHNYQRNPLQLSSSVFSNHDVSRRSAMQETTSDVLGTYSPQSMYARNLMKRERKGIYLPSADDDNSFIGDSIAHHPNIASSRAPLQFSTHSISHHLTGSTDHSVSTNDSLCPKVLSGLNSDQFVGIPYTLKVANVRRKNVDTSQSDVGSHLDQNHSSRFSNGNPDISHCSVAQQNNWNSNDSVGFSDTHTSQASGNHVRLQPDGVSLRSEDTTEFESYGFGTISRSIPTPLLHDKLGTCPTPSNFGTGYLTKYNNSSSPLRPRGASKVDLSNASFAQSVCSHLSSAENSNGTNLANKTDQRIVASAETEDGKIKVVHFGLV